jgi:hypothetical protein
LEPQWVRWIMGVLSSHLLQERRAVESGRSEGGGSGGGTSMAPVTGDENRKGRQWGIAVFGGGRRRGGSTVPEADDTMKSGAEAGDAEGVDWRPKVEDNQRKLGQWAKCAIGPNC